MRRTTNLHRELRFGLQRFGVMRKVSRIGQLRLARRIVDLEWIRRKYRLGCEPVRNEVSGPETLEVQTLLGRIGEGYVESLQGMEPGSKLETNLSRKRVQSPAELAA